jgi:hypothetical protein
MEKTLFDSERYRSRKNEFIDTYDPPVRDTQTSKRKKTQKPKKSISLNYQPPKRPVLSKKLKKICNSNFWKQNSGSYSTKP